MVIYMVIDPYRLSIIGRLGTMRLGDTRKLSPERSLPTGMFFKGPEVCMHAVKLNALNCLV